MLTAPGACYESARVFRKQPTRHAMLFLDWIQNYFNVFVPSNLEEPGWIRQMILLRSTPDSRPTKYFVIGQNKHSYFIDITTFGLKRRSGGPRARNRLQNGGALFQCTLTMQRYGMYLTFCLFEQAA